VSSVFFEKAHEVVDCLHWCQSPLFYQPMWSELYKLVESWAASRAGNKQ
jgi:hypothetical protein